MAKYASQMDPDELADAGLDTADTPATTGPATASEQGSSGFDFNAAMGSDAANSAVSTAQNLLNQEQVAPGQSVGISLGVPTVSPEEKRAAAARTDASLAKAGAVSGRVRSDVEVAQEKVRLAKEELDAAIKKPLAQVQGIVNREIKPASAELKRLDKDYEKIKGERSAHQLSMSNAINDMDRFSKAIAAEQPRDIWADASTPVKAASIALMALGAAAQTFYGDKTNVVTDQIDAVVKRDMMMQKMRMEKGQDDYRNRNLLVGQLGQHFERIEHAEDAAYITAIHGITARLEAAKAMMTAPELKLKLDETITGLQIKAALAQQNLAVTMGGVDQRLAGQEAKINADREAELNKAPMAQIRATTALNREQRLGQKEGRDQSAQMIPHWHTKDGKPPKGTTKEIATLRDGEVTTRKVTQAMDNMIKQLDSVKNPTELLDTNAYREYAAAEARLIEAARGPGFGQTGSRLTETLKHLEEAAFTPGALGRLTPRESKKLLLQAKIMIKQSLAEAFDERNFAPDDDHPVYGKAKK